jgi:TP901 family phage tail tape measure protein
MARRPAPIVQRLAFEGGDEIIAELKRLGLAGEVTARELKKQFDALNKTGLGGFTASLQKAQKDLERVGKSLQRTGAALTRTGRTLSLAISAPIVGGFGLALKAATDFEAALVDVQKVVEFPTPESLVTFGEEIRKLAPQLNVSTGELLAIAEAAGKAGIAFDELLEFVALVAKASVALDLSFAKTGESLAKIKTSLGLTVPEVKLLADAINQLGDNTGAAEAEIIDIVQRMGPLAKQAGITREQLAAIGSAMISTGTDAATAATAIRNVVLALVSGESATPAFAAALEQIGLTSADVAKRMQTDGIGTILDIFDRIQEQAPHVRLALINALFDKRAVAGVAGLVGNMGELRRQLGLVADATEFAGSVNRTFALRAETASFKFGALRKDLENLAIVIGNELLPVVVDLAEKLADFVTGLSDSEASVKRWGIVIAGIAAAIGPFVFVLGVFITTLGKFATGLAWLTRGFIALNALIATGGLAAAIAGLVNPVGAFLAVVGLLAGAIYLVSRAFGAGTEAADVHREALAKMETAISDARKGIPGAAEAVQSLGEANLQAAEAALENAEASLAMLKVQQEIEARSVNPAFGIPKDTLQLIDEYLQTIRNLRLKVDETRERMALGEKAAADYAKGLSRSAGDVATLGNTVDEVGSKISKFPGPAANVRTLGKDDLFGPAKEGAKELGDEAERSGRKTEAALGGIQAKVVQVDKDWLAARDAAVEAGRDSSSATDAAADSAGRLAEEAAKVGPALTEAGTAAGGALEPVQAGFAEAAASMGQLGTAATTAFTGLEVEAGTTATALPGLFATAADAIAAAFAGAFGRIRSDLAGLTSAVNSAIASMTVALARLRAAIAAARAAAASAAASSGGGGGGGSGFAGGGYVLGPGTATSDSISARLSNREFVQPAAAVAEYGVDFMRLLQFRRLPREIVAALMHGGEALRRLLSGGVGQGFAGGGLAVSLDGMRDRVDRSLSALAPVPRFAGGGLALAAAGGGGGGGGQSPGRGRADGAARNPVTLDLRPAGMFRAFVDDDVLDALTRVARRKSHASAGRRQEFVP